MFAGYHKTMNAHALQFMTRGIDMPDVDLGIGFAEHLAPLAQKTQYAVSIKPPEVTPIQNIDQTNLAGANFSMALFPNQFYTGEALGGF